VTASPTARASRILPVGAYERDSFGDLLYLLAGTATGHEHLTTLAKDVLARVRTESPEDSERRRMSRASLAVRHHDPVLC